MSRAGTSFRESLNRRRRAGSVSTTASTIREKNLLRASRDSETRRGFSKSDAESAMSANSTNLATDKYSDEKRKRNAQGQPRNYIQARTFNT